MLSDALPIQADLSKANLGGMNLTDASVTLADMHGDNLRGRISNCAWLLQADLSHADMQQAELGNANLSGVDLLGATVTDEQLTRAAPPRAQPCPTVRCTSETDVAADLVCALSNDA